MFQKRYDAIVAKSGQITIPVAIRKQLGLKTGQTVHQSIENGKIILEFDLPNRSGKQIDKAKRKD